MPRQPIVLVVEPEKAFHDLVAMLLAKHGVGVLHAMSAERATELAITNVRIDVISMSARISENDLDTLPLIRKLRMLWPTVAMVATSIELAYRRKMVEAGCSHECPRPHDLIQMMLDLTRAKASEEEL